MVGLDQALPSVHNERHYVFVYIPRAFAHPAQFQATVAAIAQGIPHVVNLTASLGDDWSGEASVFFMIILEDAVSRRDQLLNTTNRISETIV